MLQVLRVRHKGVCATKDPLRESLTDGSKKTQPIISVMAGGDCVSDDGISDGHVSDDRLNEVRPLLLPTQHSLIETQKFNQGTSREGDSGRNGTEAILKKSQSVRRPRQ